MRDRYLFSADRKASEYKHVLEIMPGRARLLTPNDSAWGWRWAISLGVLLAYGFILWPLGIGLIGAGVFLGPAVAWVVALVAAVVWLGGLVLVFRVVDRKSLLFLADDPSHAENLMLLGARSFGTFQDVRARSPYGEEFHLVVDAPAPRFWEAVRVLQGKSARTA